MIKEIKHNLKKPFEYACKGEKVFAKHITIKSPTRHNLNDLSVLEGEYYKVAIASMETADKLKKFSQENKDDKKVEQDEGLSFHMMMSMGGADMGKCYKAFDNILISEKNGLKMALIDDKEPITDVILENIDINDYKSLFGKYISNFLGISPEK